MIAALLRLVLATLAATGAVHGAEAPEGARALFFAGDLAGTPRATQPCAACHGMDAGGLREGGVVAPAIDGAALAYRPAGPAYDAAALGALLSAGRTPEGRTIDRTMPRVPVDAALAQELMDVLGRLAQEDAAGVDPDRIRLAVASARPDDPLPRALAGAIDRQSEGGRIFGRRVAVEALRIEDARREASRLFAVIGPTAAERASAAELARLGTLVLFPRYPLDGDEPVHRVRAISADFAAIGRALAAAARPCGAIKIDDAGSHAVAPVLRRVVEREARADPAASMRCRIVLADRATASLEPDEHLIAPFDAMHRRLPELAKRLAPATLIDVRPQAGGSDGNPSPPGDVERFADAAALVLVRGLADAGRRLTRTRFMQAVDELAAAPPNWPSLDFRRHRLTGTVETGTIRLGQGP